MMTAQPGADRVKAFACEHANATSPPLATIPSVIANEAAELAISEVSSISPATSPSIASRKRKEHLSLFDDINASVSVDANDYSDECKDQQLQPSKKSRRELPPHTVAILKGWMLSREHVKHPYPTDEDKQMLLKKTGISMKQLTNWFTNARKRIWKPMMRREHSRQIQSAMEFDQTAVREFPGAGLNQQFAVSSYAPRSVLRHSFDAGSLSAPPRTAALSRYARPQASPINAPLYPTRAGRSMSEVSARTDVDDYLDAVRIRERVSELGNDNRVPRNSLLPHGHKILQDWVNSNLRRDFPYLNDIERLKLARDTGLDVSQVDGWITSLREQMGGHSMHLPQALVATKMAFSPLPAYGERRSIPASGNLMFPSRATSISSAGNLMGPPPSSRQKLSDTRYANFSSVVRYPGRSMSRMRSMTMTASPYLNHPTSISSVGSSQQQSAGSALPSLSSRNLMSRPPPTVTSNGPTMGQPRDSRSRTLDMGQFADARRRKMTFQDILASTNGISALPAPKQASLSRTPSQSVASSNNVENMYLNDSVQLAKVYQSAAFSGFERKHSPASVKHESKRVACKDHILNLVAEGL